MKVFLSWSGDQSRHVASALRQWLPSVMQSVKPWMSEQDIEAGSRWPNDLQTELEDTHFGVVCVTSHNTKAPWLLFEAGALSKRVRASRVCPYLTDIGPEELSGPLAQFQAKTSDKEGTRELVSAINNTLKEEDPGNALSGERLDHAFDKWWDDLREVLSQSPDSSSHSGLPRTPDEKLDEVLLLVREIARSEDRNVHRLGSLAAAAKSSSFLRDYTLHPDASEFDRAAARRWVLREFERTLRTKLAAEVPEDEPCAECGSPLVQDEDDETEFVCENGHRWQATAASPIESFRWSLSRLE